jgi:hypothetical protein
MLSFIHSGPSKLFEAKVSLQKAWPQYAWDLNAQQSSSAERLVFEIEIQLFCDQIRNLKFVAQNDDAKTFFAKSALVGAVSGLHFFHF